MEFIVPDEFFYRVYIMMKDQRLFVIHAAIPEDEK